MSSRVNRADPGTSLSHTGVQLTLGVQGLTTSLARTRSGAVARPREARGSSEPQTRRETRAGAAGGSVFAATFSDKSCNTSSSPSRDGHVKYSHAQSLEDDCGTLMTTNPFFTGEGKKRRYDHRTVCLKATIREQSWPGGDWCQRNSQVSHLRPF